MRARQKVTRAGIQLIAAFEGLRRRAARLPDGRWTIGYGHTLSAREGAEVSEEDAQALLHFDLLPIAEAVNSLVFTPLTQNQFDALTAFAYNVGIDQFRTSDVLKRVNEGRLTEAACAIDLWRKADLSGEPVILDALIRRRASEKALFLTPPDGFVPTPSPLVRPRVDTDLAPALPQSRPAEIDVPMEGAVAEVHRRAEPVDDLSVEAEPEALSESVPEAPAEPAPDFAAVAPVGVVESDHAEITHSDAEPPETLPQSSEAVEASYADSPFTAVDETPAEIAVETVSATEPGADAIGLVDDQPLDGRVSDEPVVQVLEPEPAPVADIPSFDHPPIEAQAVEVFPTALEPQSLEPAVELAPEAPFPTAQEFEPAAPEPQAEFVHQEPAPEAEPQPEPQPEPSIALANTPPERIYAPEPEAEPQPAVEAAPEPVAPEPVAAPEPLPFEPPSGWSLTPPPEVIEPAPSRQDTAPPAVQTGDEDQVALFDPDSMDQDVAGRIIRYEDLQEDDGVADRSSSGPFILMGVIGLTAVGGALAAYIKGTAGTGGPDDLKVLAWILAFVGAGLVGTSVYFLLKRLGGVDD